MEDAVEAGEVELVLGQVDTRDLEAGGVLLLQGDVVVVRERIERDKVVAVPEQRLGQVRADEAGGSGNEVAQGYASAMGSGSSSENGSSAPSSLATSVSWEKKRVITTPSRKSPSRGSGRSPRASAKASSG
jgi:hypothetical protein